MTFEEAVEHVRSGTSKEEALKIAYDILTAKYRGYRIRTYTHFFAMFEDRIDTLWAKNGFLHCNSQNYLLKELLAQSGRFTDADFRGRWTTIWIFSPHQYLQIRVDSDRWIDVDMWAKVYGIPFGDHAHGFH